MDQLNTVPCWQQPYPFWFWNGKLEDAEIRAQIARLHLAGITEFVIHGRTGLQTPFLSEAWFTAVRSALDAAAALGMRVWIYDEYNWPSGTAGTRITADPANREHFVTADGTLQPEMDRYRGPLSVDYLNPACTQAFIDQCYQPYYDRFAGYFGTVIAGFFNDEPRFTHPYPWSPSLAEPIPAAEHFYDRLGQLVVQRHFSLIRQWCDAHDVVFSGHAMGEESLGSQTRYMGDAWSVVNCYRWPGVDHLGSAAQGLHPRLAASIAHLTGNRMVTCETFAGCPWEITEQDLYRIAGWLYANGITRILFHGFFYTREGEARNDWPPDLFFRWSGWEAMPAFIRWAGRIQYFLARAIPRSRVALYYPLAEFQAAYRPDMRYTLNYTDAANVDNDEARTYHLQFGELMNSMLRRGIDFDIVPAAWLERVTDRLLVAPYQSTPEFAGRTLRQGRQTAEECIVQLEEMLGRRVRVTGDGAIPQLRPVRPLSV